MFVDNVGNTVMHLNDSIVLFFSFSNSILQLIKRKLNAHMLLFYLLLTHELPGISPLIFMYISSIDICIYLYNNQYLYNNLCKTKRTDI